jgi:hypothetical protein
MAATTKATRSNGAEASEVVRGEAAAEAPVASGLYRWSPTPRSRLFEELRLDVDGWYPQMTASGFVRASASLTLHWIADVTAEAGNTWSGPVWYRDGPRSLMRHSSVRIAVSRGRTGSQQTATVEFSGAGAPVVRTFTYRSRHFHPVSFEFDVVEGARPVLSYNVGAHPNRPSTLPVETLTIERVFERAGFDTSVSRGSGRVPLRLAGLNQTWSDAEMHDAMQAFWSKFQDRPRWALWVLFASLHTPDPGEAAEDLGGIMFDDIGPNHRQGTSIFVDSFISQPPGDDPAPDAWVRRMTFWCACHEMGHAFNLAHSWDKAVGADWIQLANEPEARSFMNYPYNVAGEEPAFFADFEYRFSDSELLFMRHAPERFVQMGAADWFDDHAFERAAVGDRPTLQLVLRANRERPQFEFMEPVTLELKLTNVSRAPLLVDRYALRPDHELTIVTKRDGQPARQFRPYARYCRVTAPEVLMPGQSKYESLYLSSGLQGWGLAEPGNYTIQVLLEQGETDVVSNAMRLRVTPPASHDEEYVAQDFFSDDVGRIIAFDGSRQLASGNDTLREVSKRLARRRVALHAALALGEGVARPWRQLVPDETAPAGIGFVALNADPKQARSLLDTALKDNAATMVESLGHIDYRGYVDRFCDWLVAQGDPSAGYAVQDVLLKTLAKRTVSGRKVLDSVLADVQARRDGLVRGAGARRATRQATKRGGKSTR